MSDNEIPNNNIIETPQDVPIQIPQPSIPEFPDFDTLIKENNENKK